MSQPRKRTRRPAPPPTPEVTEAPVAALPEPGDIVEGYDGQKGQVLAVNDAGTAVIAPLEGEPTDAEVQEAVREVEIERFPAEPAEGPAPEEPKEEVVIEPDLPLEGAAPAEREPVGNGPQRRQAERYARRAREERARLGAVATYVAGPRGLKINGEFREPGAEVPEALDWPRVHTWVASGRIVPVPA